MEYTCAVLDRTNIPFVCPIEKGRISRKKPLSVFDRNVAEKTCSRGRLLRTLLPDVMHACVTGVHTSRLASTATIQKKSANRQDHQMSSSVFTVRTTRKTFLNESTIGPRFSGFFFKSTRGSLVPAVDDSFFFARRTDDNDQSITAGAVRLRKAERCIGPIKNNAEFGHLAGRSQSVRIQKVRLGFWCLKQRSVHFTRL